MKYWFVLFLILALILSPIVINIQHYFIYSDSPFLTPQFESVKAKDILVKYFNYSSYDEIYVIAKGNYSQILHQVNLTAEEYLQGAKVLTPYQFINDTLKPYYKFTQNIINKTFQSLLTLHNIYLNLTLERESILQNFSYFLFQLNVTYGIPLHEFYSNSKVALQFIAIYSKLNGSQLERARNSSLIVFHNPYILLFSFNNYSDEKLVEETIENFSNYSLLVYYLTGRNISNFALEYPYNYSLQLVEKEFPKPPISLSTFHKNDTWLIIVEVPSNESLTNVENFMAHLNYTVTGHLPIYAESALATESDLRVIDIVTVLLLSILLIVLIRALVPILVLITSAVIGLEIAYTTLYVLTFFGYSIYYISGLVIPPIVFGITVDYSILFLYRFFEEYRKGYSKEIALKRAFKNSGRALLFSGLSITIGFASFILSPSPLLRNIGIALVASSISSLIPSILFTYSVLGVIPVNMLKFPRKEVPNPVDVRRKYLEKVSNRAIKYKFLVLVLIILTGVASYIIFISHTTNVSVSEIVPKNSEVLTGERELKTFFNYSVDYIIL
ncbi:antibiotic transporter, partial [Sulfolobus sp. SCGC AB-777_L09]